MMKKYIQNIWMRILSCFLCTLSIVVVGTVVVIDVLYGFQNHTTFIMVTFFLLLIVALVLLILSTPQEAEQLGVLHRVPMGIYSGIMFFIEYVLLVIISDGLISAIYYNSISNEIGGILLIVAVGCVVLLAFTYLQNMIARICTRCFWRYSEIYYVLKIVKWIWHKFKNSISKSYMYVIKIVRENISLLWKGMGILVLIALLEFFIIIVNVVDRWNPEGILIWFFVGKIIEIPLVLYVLLQMETLQEGTQRIATGDLSEAIDTSKMFWEFKKHGDNINNVSKSIHLAVNEQMKSERFKTELITNVSHDIKTPLTSIINYVDLIKKEAIADERLCEYVEVLDRQSARLKKLIEDLIEASKASTGNLTVNLEECDVEVLLTQIIGEFGEKLQANALEVVLDKPEHPVLVMADGRHMWRVLDNLLGNACKYAMPNTRLYVSLKEEGEIITIIFKNISKAALNIPSEDLLERFVRGDSSRNTEGSGLGLSIAQSLTELMSGSMRLDIDGDLFKVTLKFYTITPGIQK